MDHTAELSSRPRAYRILLVAFILACTLALVAAGPGTAADADFSAGSSPALLASPDLTLSKTVSGDFLQGQKGAVFTLTPRNIGTVVTSGTVTVVDYLPAEFTYVSATGSGWTCTYDEGWRKVNCTRPNLIQPGMTGTAIILTVNVSPTANGSILNVATVSGGGEINTANNNGSVEVNIIPQPDLTITKSHAGDFYPGQQNAEYTIVVTNAGDSNSGGFAVEDTLPSGLVYKGFAGTGFSCTFDSTISKVICGRSGIYPNISATLKILVNVSQSVPDQVINLAEVITEIDRDWSNNTASDPTITRPVPDLSITKSHTGSFRQGQQGAVYTLEVENVGQIDTNGTVRVNDTLPAGLTAVSMSGEGWTCELETLTCTRQDALAVGSAYPAITLAVNVANDAPVTVTNEASVYISGETKLDDNKVSDPTQVQQVADLTLYKHHNTAFLQGQPGERYYLRVTNDGPGPTVGMVTVTDDGLPQELAPVSISGTGWDCSLVTLTCTRSDALLPGHSYEEITLTVNVSETAAGWVTNTARVEGGGELDTYDNTAEDMTFIASAPDLTIQKTHEGDFYKGQVGAQYTITVSNVGETMPVSEVRVVDELPYGLTATAIGGVGWTCQSLPALDCTSHSTVKPGNDYPPITLTVNVSAYAPGTVTNTARVSTAMELITNNNASSDSTTILPFIDLVVTKSHQQEVFFSGQTGKTFTLNVANIGSGASSGEVTVRDTLEPPFTATAIAGEGWLCNLDTLSCTRSDPLNPGQNYPPVTVTVDISPGFIGWATNTVTVEGGSDRIPYNNIGLDSVYVQPVPDLVVAKEHAGVFTRGQPGAQYAITVTNNGNGPTTAPVTVTDTLPPALSATALTGDGWSCSLETLTCTRSDALAAGAGYPEVILTVRVSPDAPYQLTNTASVSGGGELNTGNNSAGDPTVIYAPPAVTSHPAGVVTCAGQTVAFTAQAEGNPAPTVQWQVSADSGETWDDLPGATSNDLSFTATADLHGRWYRAVFSNAAGSLETNYAALVVNLPPDIFVTPEELAVKIWQVASFQAGVAGRPGPVIGWQVSTDGETWQEVPGEETDLLSFTAQAAHNGLFYRAAAQNVCDAASSSPVRLWVQYTRLYLPVIGR